MSKRMTFDEALFNFLQRSKTISELVGDRIFMDWAPSGTKRPYITRLKFSNQHEKNLSGGSGIGMQSIQIDVWADDDETREKIGQALRNRLDTFVGKMQKVFINHCLLTDENDSAEPRQDGSNTPIYRRRMDFDFGVTESVPNFR